METKDTDRFVLSVISLAFALKKLLESEYYDESKHKFIRDFTRLKNRLQFYTKILEQKETAQKILSEKGGDHHDGSRSANLHSQPFP